MITIDATSTIPPFEQLRAGIVEAIDSGKLAPGHRLPTVRGYAEQLGVAAGTVARAYRELEALGVIETRGRNGTFVSLHADVARREAQRAALEYARVTRALGLTADDAIAIVTSALSD